MKMSKKFILPALVALAGCSSSPVEPTKESSVGSTYSQRINWLSFAIDTTYLDSSAMTMVAEGRVKNLGTTTIDPDWIVEAQFYSDSTFKMKLGGNVDTIRVNLEPGIEVTWKIEFASTSVDPLEYPSFRVSNLRGIGADK